MQGDVDDDGDAIEGCAPDEGDDGDALRRAPDEGDDGDALRRALNSSYGGIQTDKFGDAIEGRTPTRARARPHARTRTRAPVGAVAAGTGGGGGGPGKLTALMGEFRRTSFALPEVVR